VGTRRLFFALWPEADFIARLRTAAHPLQLAGGRAVADLDLHVTLCFLGAVEETSLPALCERAAALRLPPFELEFEAIEYWSRSRVLAATSATVPAAGMALAGALHAQARALGLRTEEHPLRAHVTLWRGSAADRVPAAGPWPLSPPLRLAAGNFYLAQSQQLEATSAGSLAPCRYARLVAWPLRIRDPGGH
jgi:RNA 2',3'-cyclic 3'-phosphodiesterase